MLGAHNAKSLEEERMRVSRELHDEMGQQLAALRMEVAVLGKHMRAGQPPEQNALAILVARVDGIVASMRSVVAQLRPPALDGGLATAINWLATEFTRLTGVPVHTELDACTRSLPPDTATMLFRIAQESLNNVRRHAQATQVTLRLCQEQGDCELLIKDNGLGFDSRRHRSGYGLLGIEERARALGGTVTVESVPGAGTTVRLRMRANVLALA
jgi:signal transduction histidine kinase